MSSINSDEIISILKEEIENFDTMSKDSEVGTVVTVGDGIATIYGIDHAMYGEIVTFENGLKGMVQDIRKNEIGCILFGSDTGIREGTKVARTGKKAGVPVGDAYVGRVVNALGEAIDGKGEIKSDDYRPIENEAVQEMYADSMSHAGLESAVRFSVQACATWMQSLEEMTGLLRSLRMQQRRLMQILQQ